MSCFRLPAIGGGHPPLPPPCSTSNAKSDNPRDRSKQIVSLLKNCRNTRQITELHAKIIRIGHEHDPFVVFELLRASSRFRSIEYASNIFRQTRNPNVYVFTAQIDGFVSSGSYFDGICLYYQMIEQSVVPDNYATTSVLKACGFQSALDEGKQIHGHASKLGLITDRSVNLKLMEFYGKCGEFDDARRVFDENPQRDVVASTVMISCYADHGLIEDASAVFESETTKDTVCWTAMIDGLVRNGEANKALDLFRQMLRKFVKPNEFTIVCVLSACSQLGSLELGKWVHSYLEKHDIQLNHLVGSALVNVYSRCGSIDQAQKVFDEIPQRDVTTYNTMITGLALNGKSKEAIEIFRQMKNQNIRPNNVTFVGLLNACSHGCLLDSAFEIYQTMIKDYEIKPQIEHNGCIVDLLGRVGRLQEAYDFILSMETEPDHIIWGILLNACRIHRNNELGETIANFLLTHDDADSGTYTLISNVYASLGKWKKAAQARAKMKSVCIEKEPGFSSIELNDEIHEFVCGDLRHSRRDEIYAKLEELNGIVRKQSCFLQDIELD